MNSTVPTADFSSWATRPCAIGAQSATSTFQVSGPRDAIFDRISRIRGDRYQMLNETAPKNDVTWCGIRAGMKSRSPGRKCAIFLAGKQKKKKKKKKKKKLALTTRAKKKKKTVSRPKQTCNQIFFKKKQHLRWSSHPRFSALPRKDVGVRPHPFAGRKLENLCPARDNVEVRHPVPVARRENPPPQGEPEIKTRRCEV
jgi:hypothetical protein